MMAVRLRLDEIHRLDHKGIFFDANIWLYIYCPLGSYQPRVISAYSQCYAHLLKSTNTVYTDVMALSEVVNRYLRLAFDHYKKENNCPHIDYKRVYRLTDDYRQARSAIRAVITNKILAKSDVCNSQYTKESLGNLIDETNPECDFNDRHIIKLCSDNQLYLLTNDGDYRKAQVDVISDNRIFWN